MIVGGCGVTYYYVVNEIHSCTAFPAQYAAEKEVAGEYNFTIVSLNVYLDKDSVYPRDTFRYYKGNLIQENPFDIYN